MVFAALLVIVAVAAISLGANLTGSNSDYCPPPSAASVATLFAPCQAFESAMGHRVTKQEAVQMGLLTPDEQPEPPATQVAAGEHATMGSASKRPHWIEGSLLHFVFEGDALQVVFLEPCFRGIEVCKHFDMIGIADLLACIHVNEDGRLTIL
jgi:hypothetical protein